MRLNETPADTRESSYPNRLDAENAGKASSADNKLAEQDFSLYEALNILKAVSILPVRNATVPQEG